MALYASALGLYGTALADGSCSDEDCEVIVYIYSVLTGINALALIAAIIGLIGALKYNIFMIGFDVLVVVGVFAYNIYGSVNAAQTAANMALNIVLNVIFTSLLTYPSVMLITEINSGKMSAETYKREAHSCCCKPNV